MGSCDAVRNSNSSQDTIDGESSQRTADAQASVSGSQSTEVAEPWPEDLDTLQGRAPPIGANVVRVGLLLPLTGRLEDLGQAMLNAAELALFDNADKRFELLPYDTKGTPEGAASAAQRALNDNVSLVIGPLLASSVRAVSPKTLAAGIPVIAFSSDRSVSGDGTYIMGFTPSTEVEHVVAYIQQAGLTRIAALLPDTPYGRVVEDTLRQSAALYGVTITHAERYPPGTQDFSGSVSRLVATSRLHPTSVGKESLIDALLLADNGQQLQSLIAYLRADGVDTQQVKLVGTGIWDDPNLAAEDALIGGWFAAPDPRYRRLFEDRFLSIFGKPAPRLTTLAYDAVALAASVSRSGAIFPFDERRLTDPDGFFGRDGLFRFRADGTPDRSLSIQEIRPGGNQVIAESLTSFPGS